MIYHSSSATDVLSYLEVDEKNGLHAGVVEERLKENGRNIIENTKRPSLLKLILRQFKSFVNILLIVAVILCTALNFAFEFSKPFSPLLILLMLFFNIGITVICERKSEDAYSSLKSMNSPKVKVLRDGSVRIIDSSYIVVGDILILETGDYIAADARLIETSSFRCDESFVTGEEITEEKNANDICEDIANIKSRTNMVFSGSNVISGHARAVVTETGINTEVGKAVTLLETDNSVNLKTKEQLIYLGKIVSVILTVFCIIAFLTNIIINFKNDNFVLTLSQSIINSVVLLVSVLPETIPIMSAVAMGISVNALAKEGMIIKDFGVFDVLPEISVICADKTGTLTQDIMHAEKIFNGREIFDAQRAFEDPSSLSVLRLASICTSQSKDDIDCPMYNDATEIAILNTYKQSITSDQSDVYNMYPRFCKLPFNPQTKITVTINIIDGVPYAIAKGAPDYLLSLSKCADKELAEKTVNDFAASGMRVIAVCYKQLSSLPSNPEQEDLETDMNFAGLIALSDPPQADSISLIEECDNGSIKTVMITGDHMATARAVARKIGILKDGTEIISGEQLAAMSDEELKENIMKYSVFARLLPDQKYRIVSAFKENGMTVAITGDSVNDAQVLKYADVGIALGKSGTDVARGAADIIMNENRFSAILSTINGARGLFCGLRKALAYLFSSNLGELICIFICLFASGAFPLIAVQFLLLNLLTDSLPVISIISDGIYEHKKMHIFHFEDKALFTFKSNIRIGVQAIIITIISTVAFLINRNLPECSTMLFIILFFSQIFNMVSLKFEDFFFYNKHFRNIGTTISIILCSLIVILLVTTPLGSIFGFVSISFLSLLKALLLSSLVLLSGELTKLSFKLYDYFLLNK